MNTFSNNLLIENPICVSNLKTVACMKEPTKKENYAASSERNPDF